MSRGVFDAYAAYYDLLNRDKDYAAEVAHVDSLLNKYRPGTRSLLELGCGTGAHAEHFARLGYSVAGFDVSPEMVSRARARRAALPHDLARRLSFSAGDIGTVRAGSNFDGVISLFHVFSYQTSNAALQAAFATAAAHLTAGGLLCFDYWYGPAVLSIRPEVRVREIEDEICRVRRIAEPEMQPAANLVRVRYTIDVQGKADETRRQFTEVHDMRYLFVPEIEFLAGDAFRVVDHVAWMGAQPPGITDWAAVCVLERRR
jgi:SAM-dependent methyltransferase